MKKIKKLLFLMLITTIVLSGCYGGTNDTSKTEDKDTTADSDSESLHLAMTGEIPTLKTNGEMDGLSATIIQNIFEGLYRKGKDDDPIEGLVKDYEKNDEETIYTFKLREDAKWSNGDPITSHDFVYAWKKALHPDTFSPHADLMEPLKNAAKIQDPDDEMYGNVDELGVEAIDDYTLEVTLDSAVPYLFELLTNPVYYPQNEEFVTEQGDDYALEVDNLIFNGPYKLTKWDHDQGWVLEKNEDYWDAEEVKTNKIDFKVVKDTATEVNLYESDTIDVANLSSDFIDEYNDSDDYVTAIQSEMYFLRLNQKNEDLQNVNIRRALDMAYDKKEMSESVLKNGSIPAYFLIPPEFPEFESPSGEDFRDKYGDLNNESVEKAQEYFQKGLDELGKEEISLELLSYDDDQRKTVAEYIKNQWESNLPGLKITINQQPNKQKLSLEGNLDYDISHSGWRSDVGDPVDFLTIFLSDGPYNWQNFENEEYDKLVKKAQTDFSDNEIRFEELQEAEKILIKEEVAISPMHVAGSAKLIESYVQDFIAHGDSTYTYKWVEIKK